MSCYLRQVKDILDEAGIAVTPENRKQIDRVIHQALGVAYKNCPDTWKKIKQEIMDNQEKRRSLIRQLQMTLS